MTAAIQRFATRLALGVLLTALITCLFAKAATAQDHKQLDLQLQAIEKKLSNPLAGEAEHRGAQRQLQALLERAAAAAQGNIDDESHPIHSVHARITQSLKGVTARLPSESSAAETATGFPVPNYDDGKLLADLSNQVRSAQAALAKAIRESPKDVDLLNELLINLVLVEENLAWEAGWPFNAKEVAAYKKADQLTSEVYLSRRQRGVEQVNAQLRSEADTTGRGTSFREFVIHAPVNKDAVAAVDKAISQLRGNAAKDWRKGTKPFDAKESAALLGGQSKIR
jgi:hypothetical protein